MINSLRCAVISAYWIINSTFLRQSLQARSTPKNGLKINVFLTYCQSLASPVVNLMHDYWIKVIHKLAFPVTRNVLINICPKYSSQVSLITPEGIVQRKAILQSPARHAMKLAQKASRPIEERIHRFIVHDYVALKSTFGLRFMVKHVDMRLMCRRDADWHKRR